MSDGGATLPSGVTFVDSGYNFATLSGTPAAGTAGTYPFTITASNGGTRVSTLYYTLTVVQACQITSSAGTSFTVGQTGTFTVKSSGSPTCGLSVTSGSLPTGVTFKDNGDGTATLSGTPNAGTGGTYPFTITATNGGTPNGTQTFTLTVNEACQLASALPTYNIPFGPTGAGPIATFSTSAGTPTCTLSAAGLPAGVTFNPSTGILAEATPATTPAGTYTFTITASNVVAYATQTFTLTVGGSACLIQSPDLAATFIAGQAGTFTVTSAGSPTCALSATTFGGAKLPSWLTFTDNGDGTATLAGTPPASSSGSSNSLTITATNSFSATAPTFTFSLTVDASSTTPTSCSTPTTTSPLSATYTVGQAGTPVVFASLTTLTNGVPRCTLSATGLPAGVTLTDNGDGTATLSGTPAAGSGGTYPVTITAKNGASPNPPLVFTLYVLQGCQITSPAGTTFTAGQAGTFTVTSAGTPTCGLSATGLPSGVRFKDNGDGTATLSQASAATTAAGTYPITITAANGIGSATTQTFTLTVNQVCQITSPAGTTFTAGQAGTITVATTGVPNCALSESGKLPSGVTFTDNGNGTATISGTPAPGTGGTYLVTITATNGVGSASTQAFTLTVLQAPTITSAGHATCTVGKACAFTVRSTGVPTPALSESGNLPSGVLFTDNGNGRAALSGIPAAGTAGTYTFTITATNGVGSAANQTFTLSVSAPVVRRPAAPSSLRATGRGRSVSLTWQNNASAPSAATGILIQRSTNAGFTAGIINTTVGPRVTTHIDTAVVKGKRYYYRVRAYNSVGNSAWSNVSNVTAP